MNNKFVEWIAQASGKVGTNKFILAIRDAFADTIPITITAAFFLLINNVLLEPTTGLLRKMPGHEIITNIGIQAYNGTFGILALIITFLIACRLAKSMGSKDGVTEGVIALASYVSLVPNSVPVISNAGKTVQASSVLTQDYSSASGMMVSLLTGIFATLIMMRLQKSDKLKIHMPDSVPPAVGNSFSALFPGMITVGFFAAIEGILNTTTGLTVSAIIIKILQAPLVTGFQSLPGILFYVLLSTFVFTIGIHGADVFGSIAGPVLLASLQQNIDAIHAGQAAPNIVTQPFLDAYVYMGGGGTMIALVIALLIFSKRPDERAILKIGGVPNIFNISEPIMFGLPVVFNLTYAIPFCIAPLVSTIIAYVCTALHLINATYILIPWVTPPIISGYLATGGDIRAAIMQVVIIAVDTLIYMPFVFASNHQYALKAQEEVPADDTAK